MFARVISTLRWRATEPSLKRLRNRLLAVNLISLTLVVVVAFSLVYIYYFNRTQNEIGRQIDAIHPGVVENIVLSQQILSSIETGMATGDETFKIGSMPATQVDYSKYFVVNIDDEGQLAVFSMIEITDADCLYAVNTVMDRPSSYGTINMSGHVWQYSMKDASDLSLAGSFVSYESSIVFLDIDEPLSGLRELALSLLVIGFVAIGAIFLVSLLVANRAIRPVEESMARQRRFVADASHELKTPIAVIAANAEAAKDAVFRVDVSEDAAGVTRWIDNITVEANHMDALIKSLLTLAKADEVKINESSFDLFEAIRAEADRVETFLYEKNIAFIFEPPSPDDEPLFVYSDRSKTQAILSVLFENAVKYTPDGGRVTITAGKTENTKKPKNGVWVSVANTGDFIPPEEIDRVFDRFYRADLSRYSETGGHGIGLSIAKEMAHTLKGELTVTSVKDPAGAATNTFTLYI